MAWVLEHGPLEAGEEVLHHCDNPPCFASDHLFKGTDADNMADKVRKDRARGARPGERHHSAKLTAAQVEEIRARRQRGERLAPIAAEFSVSPQLVSQIARGDVW